MLNYIESARNSTAVPLLVFPCTEGHVRITELHPEMTKQQGKEAGQAEARQIPYHREHFYHICSLKRMEMYGNHSPTFTTMSIAAQWENEA